MTGLTFATTVCSAASASLALSCAAASAVIASTRLWRTWRSDAVVYAVFPSVNDPFGKCLLVPAMSACTCAKASALVTSPDVFDMISLFLSDGGDRRTGRTCLR
jgi:hypothetical protein